RAPDDEQVRAVGLECGRDLRRRGLEPSEDVVEVAVQRRACTCAKREVERETAMEADAPVALRRAHLPPHLLGQEPDDVRTRPVRDDRASAGERVPQLLLEPDEAGKEVAG